MEGVFVLLAKYVQVSTTGIVESSRSLKLHQGSKKPDGSILIWLNIKSQFGLGLVYFGP